MGTNTIRRLAAGILAVVVALATWNPILPAAPSARAHAPTEAAKPKDSCACPKCPGQAACCCDHGQAPEGSACSAATSEPGNTVADASVTVQVGKIFCTVPTPVVPPRWQPRFSEVEQAQRSYPYPAPLDKVPI